MGCTIYDISQVTGYSIATISRVINNRGLVKPETRERVLEVIDRLGYQPSVMARGLASNAAHIIGLGVGQLWSSQFESNYSLLHMNGVVTAAGERGYDVLIVSERKGGQQRNVMRSRQVDGMVYVGLHNNHDAESMIEQGFPIVYAGVRQAFDPGGHNIYGGYHLYKQEMLDILYSRGYRNVLFIEHQLKNRDLVSTKAFWQIVQSFGKSKGDESARCRLLDYDYRNEEGLRAEVAALMKGPNRPDALCLDTNLLYPAMHEILQELGLKIPDDLGVIVTSHNKNSGPGYSPALTCIYLDAYEMGRRCAELLINQIEGSTEEVDPNVPYQFIERDSLRPPK